MFYFSFYNESESHLNFADGLFKLPYRVVFAVATLNSLYVYDTESVPPILVHAGLHYAAITDIAWWVLIQFCFCSLPIELCISTGASNSSLQSIYVRSSDAKYLAVSSRDGYCTIIEFENEELGELHILPGISPFHSSFRTIIYFLRGLLRTCMLKIVFLLGSFHSSSVYIMVNFSAVLGFNTESYDNHNAQL
jgi:hypothetical protein